MTCTMVISIKGALALILCAGLFGVAWAVTKNLLKDWMKQWEAR